MCIRDSLKTGLANEVFNATNMHNIMDKADNLWAANQTNRQISVVSTPASTGAATPRWRSLPSGTKLTFDRCCLFFFTSPSGQFLSFVLQPLPKKWVFLAQLLHLKPAKTLYDGCKKNVNFHTWWCRSNQGQCVPDDATFVIISGAQAEIYTDSLHWHYYLGQQAQLIVWWTQ